MTEILEIPETPKPPGASELWVPGMPLEFPLKTPGSEPQDRSEFATQFAVHFADTVWPDRPYSDFASIYPGLTVLALPEQKPTGYAFIDLDDCVVELSTSLRRLQYPDDDTTPRKNHHDYGEGMFFSDSDNAIKHPLTRLVKASEIGCVPTEGIGEISSTMRSWRKAGIYVTFITSAIKDAELSAIDDVARHFRESCDGIAVTSGHYKTADKGEAATQVIDFGGAAPGTPVVHIDDLIFNTTKVRKALNEYSTHLTVQTFQPLMPTGFDLDPDSHHEHGTLATFGAATEFFEAHLGRSIHVPLHAILQCQVL